MAGYFITHFQGRGDSWIMIWNFWWFKQAVVALHASPLFCDYAWWPLGVDLHYHSTSPLNSLASVPLQFFLPLPAVDNLFFLSTFVLSGWAAFGAAYQLTRNTLGSLVAGWIFAFSPYHFYHRYQLEHLSIQWIALFLWTFLRWQERRTPARAVCVAGAYLAIFYANIYYGLFSSVLALLFFMNDIFFRDRKTMMREKLIGWTVIAASSGTGAAPWLIPMFRQANQPGRFKIPAWINIHQSLDLFSFITPSPHNPLLASWFPLMPLYDRFTGWENIGYLGFSVMVLACVGARAREFTRRKFLVLVCACFLILSLGPVLHVAGIVTLPGDRPIPMPQALLQVMPVISAARVPARYLAVAMLPLAILAGMGASRLAREHRVLLAPLLVLVVLEYWNAPMEMTLPPDPEYCRVIAKDPDDCAVMDLPLKISTDSSEWWRSADPDERGWLQTLHGKRSLGGPISHTALTRAHFEYFLASPVLSPLVNDVAAIPDTTAMAAEFRRIKLKYFVLHHSRYQGLPEGMQDRDLKYILSCPGAEIILRNEDVILVRTN
ncbi:MAG: hypothetical protein AAB229_08805 [Candidatus Hydrogenedentota bacterium]